MKNLRLTLSTTFSARQLLASSGSFPSAARKEPAEETRSLLQLRAFVVLCCLLIAQAAQAQDASTYQLAATAGTFTPITGGTPLAVLAQTDAISPIIALPFTFYYGGIAFTALQATTRGYLTFNPQSLAYGRNTLGLGNNTVAPCGTR